MLTREQWKRRREIILYVKLGTIGVLSVAIISVFLMILID